MSTPSQVKQSKEAHSGSLQKPTSFEARSICAFDRVGKKLSEQDLRIRLECKRSNVVEGKPPSKIYEQERPT